MKEISEMTVKELKQYAKDNGIDLGQATRKPDILNVILGKTPPEFSLSRELKVTKPLMKGADVKAVQDALIAAGYGCGVGGSSGVYNADTAKAVRHFQSMNRLIVNGRVNKFTAEALGGAWTE